MEDTNKQQFIREVLDIEEVQNSELEKEDIYLNSIEPLYKVILTVEYDGVIIEKTLYMAESGLELTLNRGYI